jgi:hypothetical protein
VADFVVPFAAACGGPLRRGVGIAISDPRWASLTALFFGPESLGNGVTGDDTIGVVTIGRSWTMVRSGLVNTVTTTALTNNTAAPARAANPRFIASSDS